VHELLSMGAAGAAECYRLLSGVEVCCRCCCPSAEGAAVAAECCCCPCCQVLQSAVQVLSRRGGRCCPCVEKLSITCMCYIVLEGETFPAALK
jgi:hypothetical protein